MEIVVSNKIMVKNPPENLKQIMANKLKFDNPVFVEAQKSGRSVWNIQPHIINFSVTYDGNFIVPRGIMNWIEETSQALGIEYSIKDERTIFDHMQLDSSKIEYRPYQFDAVLNLTSVSSGGVLVSPAGSGKTIMGLSLIPMLGQPTMWLTHTNPLVTQTTERAEAFLPDIGEIGIVGNGKWKIGKVLTIGIIQTLTRNISKVAIELKDRFGMVIVDEAHRVPSRTFSEVAGQFNAHYLYGLTATPYRRDKLESLMFQALGESKTVVKLEEVRKYGGIVVPTIRYRTVNSKRVDDNNIQRILKYHIVNNTKRNHMIVGDVIREASDGHFCIVMSDRKEHCEILHQLISIGWEKTGIATGNYSKKYVDEQVKLFNDRKITVLVATSALLGEGFDVPFLDRGFLAMPFRAEAKCEQIVGRIQRTHPGKKDAILYDYVDVDIGVLKNQFHNKTRDCRYRTYIRIGANIEPY